MWVKVCGVREQPTAVALAGLPDGDRPDAVGLNFFPGSRRCVEPETAERIVAALDGATAFSAAMWINLDAAGFSGDQYWLSVAHAPNHDNELLVGINGNTIRWYFDDVRESDSFSVVGWPSTWKHLVLARPSGLNLMNIYVDGSLVHTENISSTVVSVDPNGLWIGGDQDSVGGGFNSGQQFDGLMDDFRIYDHALSASEVAVLAGGAPEPAETFAFLGLLTAAGLGFREWRSRRKAKAA